VQDKSSATTNRAYNYRPVALCFGGQMNKYASRSSRIRKERIARGIACEDGRRSDLGGTTLRQVENPRSVVPTMRSIDKRQRAHTLRGRYDRWQQPKSK